MGGRPAVLRHRPALPDRAARLGPDHDGRGHARRAASPAAERALPGPDHADARRSDDGRAQGDQLPERWPRVPGPPGDRSREREHPPAGHRRRRHRLPALCGDRGRRHVPDRAHPRARQARPRVGGHPAERIGRAGRWRQRHALQDVGLRARVVPDGRRRGAASGELRPALHHDLPHQRLDHPARRRADGRHLQPVGSRRGGTADAAPAGAPEQLGRRGRLADDRVRHRHPPGAPHRAAGPGLPVPARHGEARTADRRARRPGRPPTREGAG